MASCSGSCLDVHGSSASRTASRWSGRSWPSRSPSWPERTSPSSTLLNVAGLSPSCARREVDRAHWAKPSAKSSAPSSRPSSRACSSAQQSCGLARCPFPRDCFTVPVAAIQGRQRDVVDVRVGRQSESLGRGSPTLALGRAASVTIGRTGATAIPCGGRREPAGRAHACEERPRVMRALTVAGTRPLGASSGAAAVPRPSCPFGERIERSGS